MTTVIIADAMVMTTNFFFQLSALPIMANSGTVIKISGA